MKALKLFRTLLVAAVSGLIVGASSTAFSAPPVRMPRAPGHDVKIFPGALCMPESTLAVDYISSTIHADEEGIQITCPVMRDDATGTDGIYMGRVSVWDNDPVNNTTCCLQSYSLWGDFVAGVCDYADIDGWQILDLTLDQSAEYGIYTLECVLAYPGGISAYRIYEHQDGYDDMTDYDN